MKKIAGILAALAMAAAPLALCTMSVSADSADVNPTDWALECYPTDNDPYYTIVHYAGDDDGKLVVPASIDGKTIRGIETDAIRLRNCDEKEIIISDGIEFIEGDAFDFGIVRSLTMTIPASVTYIDSDMLGRLCGYSRYDNADAVIIELSNEIRSYAYYKIYTMLGMHYNYYPEEQIFFNETYLDVYNSLDWDKIKASYYQELYDKNGRVVSFAEVGITDDMLDEINTDKRFVIRGYSGSAAEKFAKINHMKFESLGAARLTGSAFSGGKLAIAGVIGLLIGILGTTAVFAPKLKKEQKS